MSALDPVRQASSKLKSAAMEYSEFNGAYEEAFDQERPDYVTEADEDTDIEEFLDGLGTDIRYLGDGIRATEDEDLQEISEDVEEYIGGGRKGQLFCSLALHEEYETAAKLFGLDEDKVKEDVAPKIEEYKQIRTERYGERVADPEELIGKIDQFAEILNPITSAYQNEASIPEFIDSLEETGRNIDNYFGSEEIEHPDVDPINIGHLIDETDEE